MEKIRIRNDSKEDDDYDDLPACISSLIDKHKKKESYHVINAIAYNVATALLCNDLSRLKYCTN